jgi:hypothetical protein
VIDGIRALPFIGMGLVGFDFVEAQQQRGGSQLTTIVNITALHDGARRGKRSHGFSNLDNGRGYLFTYQPHLHSDGCDRGGYGASYGGNRELFNDEPIFDKAPIFDEELIDDRNLVAAMSLDIDIEPSNFNNCVPFNCSTNCPSNDVNATGYAAFDEGPAFDNEGGGRDCSICGKHVAAPPMLSKVTALRVFDEMPHSTVVWDDELQHSSDSHDGLLKQLAEGVDYVVDEEFQNSLDLCDDLLQQGAWGRECMDNKLVKWDDDKVSDEIPYADVIWG